MLLDAIPLSVTVRLYAIIIPRILDTITLPYPCLRVYVISCLRGPCRLRQYYLCESSFDIFNERDWHYMCESSFDIFNERDWHYLCESCFDIFNERDWHYMCESSFDIVVGVMKIRNIVPRVGIEPISLAFWVSLLPLSGIAYHIT